MKWNKNIAITIQFTLWLLLLAGIVSIDLFFLPIKKALLLSVSTWLLLIFVSYLNTQLIIPKYFNKRKFVHYFVLMLSLLILSTLLNKGLTNFFMSNFKVLDITFPEPPPDFSQKNWIRPKRHIPLFFITITILFISTVYALAKEFLRKEENANQLIKEKVTHELNFLRSQINPHFIFNALNNLHATIQLQPEKAGDFVLKLAEMLRYILEDCNKDKVTLSDEINYIKNYIFFQQQKDKDLQNIIFEVSGENSANYQLEPMLFIPLVENAFQHNYTEDVSLQYVNISIHLNEGVLQFIVKNNLPDKNISMSNLHQERQGLGLQNVKRRLALLYPGQHIFSQEVSSNAYHVKLIIQNS